MAGRGFEIARRDSKSVGRALEPAGSATEPAWRVSELAWRVFEPFERAMYHLEAL